MRGVSAAVEEHRVPIYGYACKNCDHTLDALQKVGDAPLVDCPECGETGVAVVANGCWSCVDLYRCEPLTGYGDCDGY